MKGRDIRAILPGPPFHGLLIHFYGTNLQLLVMFILNDIYSLVLRVKGVLCHEHLRIID